jgi:hypothetical protein
MDPVDKWPAEPRTVVRQLVERLLDPVRHGWIVLAQGKKPVVDRFQEQQLPPHLLIITIPYVPVSGFSGVRHGTQVPFCGSSPPAVACTHAVSTTSPTDIFCVDGTMCLAVGRKTNHCVNLCPVNRTQIHTMIEGAGLTLRTDGQSGHFA